MNQPEPTPAELFPPQDEATAEPAVTERGTLIRLRRKVGRNETCPCGSGRKFKRCDCGISRSPNPTVRVQ